MGKDVKLMSQISIRMDEELRKKTEEILSELGLNMSAAMNILARQIVRSRGLPFPLILSDEPVPNRQKAASEFTQMLREQPAKPPAGYKLSRNSYDEEKDSLPLLNDLTGYNDPVTIVSEDNKVAVILSMETWSGIQETLYLQSVPGMVESIKTAADEPLDVGIPASKVNFDV
jgi:addiction module RelB/DinJ family antitoxin